MFDCKARGWWLPSSISFVLLLMAEELVAQTACGSYGTCELQAVSEEQTLTSDKYPDFVLKEDDTTWRIATNNDDLVNLTLLVMSTNGPSTCYDGHLQVSDDRDGVHFDLAKICHGESSRTYISSYNAIFIKYVGSPNIPLRFKLYYRSAPNPNENACTGVPLLVRASTSVKNITSPNFPLPYPRNSICRWRIVTEDKDTLVKFHVDGGRLTDCSSYAHDYIKIFDGPTEYDYLETTLCGRFLDHERVTSSHAMYVEFHSGSQRDSDVKFHISYQMIYNERLFSKDLVATKEEREVKYPSYPSVYPNHARVSWTIRSAIDSPINISILYHRIEQSSNCEHDFLEFYDGTSEFGSLRLKHLCGVQVSPQVVVSSGPSVFIRFVSDGSIVNTGFKFNFSSVSGCPLGVVHVEADQKGKEITSPGYPNRYPIDAHCQWKVTSTRGLVTVKVEALDLKGEGYCRDDYLKIYDGYSSNQALLRSFCGNSHTPVAPFNSTSTDIYIQFRSGGESSTSSNCGFKLVVQGIEDDRPMDSFYFNSSHHDSSKSNTKSKRTFYAAAGSVVSVFILTSLTIVLLYCYRPTIRRRRSRMPTVTGGSMTTLGNVIQTNRHQDGCNVLESEGHTGAAGNADLPPRQEDGIHLPDASSLSAPGFGSNTAAPNIDGDLPPSYSEVISDRQHLIGLPEYTPSPPGNSFDNRAYDQGERADVQFTQPPANHSII